MNQVGVRGTRSHRSLNPLVAGIISFFMITGALAGANSVQADSVWHQSYQRDSASEACVAQAGETPWQDSWGTNPGWSPSWEQWANNGEGGWVCSRSITWARDSAARVYNVGEIGPGGGLIFLIANGLTYEMAPKTWSGFLDPLAQSCDTNINIPGATGTAIGAGAANTAAIVAACTSGASNDATAYRGGGFTDWFLPSKDELNSMYSSSLPVDRATTYEFIRDVYWTSSIDSDVLNGAWSQNFRDGVQQKASSDSSLYVRPIRAF